MFWIIVFIITLAVEVAINGLGAITLAVGAGIAFELERLKAPFLVQISVFIGLGFILCFRSRREIKMRWLYLYEIIRLIGYSGMVVEEINNSEKQGKVEILGKIWEACNVDNFVIPVQKRVKVHSVNSSKLRVVEISID